MTEAEKKQGEIQNVLPMDDPQQMVAKLLWEILELTSAMSVWVDNEEFPVASLHRFQRGGDGVAHHRLDLAIQSRATIMWFIDAFGY
jgi:hypothetical protein